MYKKSMKNMVSDMKPSVPYEELEKITLRMPMSDGSCDMCGKCQSICSGKAIHVDKVWSVDLGKCIFCRDCYDMCPHIKPVKAPFYALKREDLVFTSADKDRDIEGRIPEEKARIFRNSLSIRELDTGSCNACEAEINAMDNKYYDMERFGLRFVASPRHADALIVTGPMTRNMLVAAEKTYAAVPSPKLIIANGTCAISGGLFVTGDVVGEGAGDTLPVDLYVVGCPPAPNRTMISIMKALGFRH